MERFCLTCGLLLCAILIFFGIVVLFAEASLLIRLILSIVSIVSGVALGGIGIMLCKDR